MNVLYSLVCMLLLYGCNTESIDFSQNSLPDESTDWYKPTVDVTWQWQLKGDININYKVDIYDIDLFDTSKEVIQQLQSSGAKVICYFSAGSYESWRSDASDYPSEVIGKKMDGWDEQWLDIRSVELRTIMMKRLDLAVEKGCNGVEPDNMDGYVNETGFDLSANDQLVYNRFIAEEAHKRGLSVGLKNDLDQIAELEPYFDFSINEECHYYHECDKMQPFINANKAVLHVEYADKYVNNTNNARDEMCRESIALRFKTLILPIELNDSFRYSCE